MSRRTELTKLDLDRVLGALDETGEDATELASKGESPSGDDAISDHDAVRYPVDDLDAEGNARVETVLASSPQAVAEMAWLKREAAAWVGAGGETRVRSIANSIRWRTMPVQAALARLKQWTDQVRNGLDHSFVPVLQDAIPLGKVFFNDLVGHGEVADGLIGWEIVRGPDRTLIVRLMSSATSLSGTALRLRVGTWNGECVLATIGPGEIGATLTIAAEHRQAMTGSSPVISIDVVEDASHGG
jgi:hypothetical protein